VTIVIILATQWRSAIERREIRRRATKMGIKAEQRIKRSPLPTSSTHPTQILVMMSKHILPPS